MKWFALTFAACLIATAGVAQQEPRYTYKVNDVISSEKESNSNVTIIYAIFSSSNKAAYLRIVTDVNSRYSTEYMFPVQHGGSYKIGLGPKFHYGIERSTVLDLIVEELWIDGVMTVNKKYTQF